MEHPRRLEPKAEIAGFWRRIDAGDRGGLQRRRLRAGQAHPGQNPDALGQQPLSITVRHGYGIGVVHSWTQRRIGDSVANWCRMLAELDRHKTVPADRQRPGRK